jgi:hypothetical protein
VITMIRHKQNKREEVDELVPNQCRWRWSLIWCTIVRTPQARRNKQKTYLTSCRDRRLISILTRIHCIATIQYDLTNHIRRILAGIPAGSVGIARIDHPSDATLTTSGIFARAHSHTRRLHIGYTTSSQISQFVTAPGTYTGASQGGWIIPRQSSHTTGISTNAAFLDDIDVGGKAGKISITAGLHCGLTKSASKTMTGKESVAALATTGRGTGRARGIAVDFSGATIDKGASTADGLEISDDTAAIGAAKKQADI